MNVISISNLKHEASSDHAHQTVKQVTKCDVKVYFVSSWLVLPTPFYT